MSRTSMIRAVSVIAAALVLAIIVPVGARAAAKAGTSAGDVAGATLDTGAVAAMVSDLSRQRAVKHPLRDPARLDAYSAPGQVNGPPLLVLVLPMARGPYYFVLRVSTAESAAFADRLMSALAAAQERKVPADTPDTVSLGNRAVDAASGAAGLLFGYLSPSAGSSTGAGGVADGSGHDGRLAGVAHSDAA